VSDRRFRPQRRNANRHTQRGLGMLERAMRVDGYVAPMTAAADGEVIDGSARLEVAADVFDGVEPLVVDHDGTRPIIMRRTDIPSADDPRAVRIALAANRIAVVDLDFDPAILAEIEAEVPDALEGLWAEDELAALLAVLPDGDEWGAAMASLPDEDRAPFRQMTFTVHDSQHVDVERAIALARDLGGAVSDVNENGNGNALAFICATFVTAHGDR